MKRGLIAWDRERVPVAAIEKRLETARAILELRGLPALLVYTDVWRSNQGRFLTNFMPYWNRSLIVIPREGKPVLLCALSPRVYPWIKSVTILEDIRPASKLMATLEQLCAERGWSRLGVLDLPKLPVEIYAALGNFEVEDVPGERVLVPEGAEFAMRERALELARPILEKNLAHASVGRLEREYRRAGAEDLMIRVKRRAGDAAYSVQVALEYCGHWVKVTRAHAPAEELGGLRACFESARERGGYRENLAGPQPYEPGEGLIYFLQVEHQGLYYGDTFVGPHLL